MLALTILQLNFIKDLLKAGICFFAVKHNMEQLNNVLMFMKQRNYQKTCVYQETLHFKYVKIKTKANLQKFLFIYFFFIWYLKLENST